MTTAHTVRVGDLKIGNDLPLTVLAGPCAMESRAHALESLGLVLRRALALAILGLVSK